MGALGTKNISQLRTKVGKMRERAGMSATKFVQSKVAEVLIQAELASPQWSGNFVANWRVYTNQNPAKGYTTKFKVADWREIDEPKQREDWEAMDWNLRNNIATIKTIKWNSNVYLTNTAPIADLIVETAYDGLRPVNKLSPHQGIHSYLKGRFPMLR
jgi:hypothetical protein